MIDHQMTKKILVTGGAGFIGLNFIKHQLNFTENIILNIDKLTYASNKNEINKLKKNPRYNFIKCDIAEKKISNIIFDFKPNVIINFAAETHVDNSINSPNTFLKTNISGTFNLLNNSLEYFNQLKHLKKNNFIFYQISTDEVFGDLGKSNKKFNEYSSYNPSSPYSATKASADFFVKSWARTYKLPFIISYCTNNYGPYQNKEKFIPNIINKLLSNKKVEVYGDGNNMRDWIYVEDHVAAISEIIENSIKNQSYCIGSNNLIKNIDLVYLIYDLLSSRVDIKIKKQSIIKYVNDRPGHDIKYALNTKKILNDLNWKPMYNIRKGIHKTLEFYLHKNSFIS